MVTFTMANRIINVMIVGRQFVEQAEQRLISDDTKELVKRLLTERISLRGVCRSVEVSLSWLMSFIVAQYEDFPDHLNVVQSKRASGIIIKVIYI